MAQTGRDSRRCSAGTTTNWCANSPCANGGTCVNGAASYVCTCAAGFTGPQCLTSEGGRALMARRSGLTRAAVDIDECAAKPCLNNGTCVDGIAAYTCACPVGYTGARCENATSTSAIARAVAQACRDSRRCSAGTTTNWCANNPCGNGGTCVNGAASYVCTCAAGFTGAQCLTSERA